MALRALWSLSKAFGAGCTSLSVFGLGAWPWICGLPLSGCRADFPHCLGQARGNLHLPEKPQGGSQAPCWGKAARACAWGQVQSRSCPDSSRCFALGLFCCALPLFQTPTWSPDFESESIRTRWCQGLGQEILTLCGPGKLLFLFEPQCAFLRNGHNSNTNPISIHPPVHSTPIY